MIQLTRLNKQPMSLNSDLIKFIEYAPDTVITLLNGEKIVVLETGEEILNRIVDFRRRVMTGLRVDSAAWPASNCENSQGEQSHPPSGRS